MNTASKTTSNFPEYKQLDLVGLAKEELQFWKEGNTFAKSVETRSGNEEFLFFEGPPSANGMPGIHHVLARTIKDIFCRYQTLQGKQVKRKAGWDTHGLPIELGVEKELGITKEDIGSKISIEEYNAACKKAVMRYTDVWNDLTDKMGYWVDLSDPYITYTPQYMESVWWLLKQLYDKNLMYKGYTIQPYSPKAGTGLSSHELNMPGTYQEVSDSTVVAQFAVDKDSNSIFSEIEGDTYILAWTTTPWTLPSNTALAVGNSLIYVLVRTYNQYTLQPEHVVLSKDLLPSLFTGKYTPVDQLEEAWDTDLQQKIPYEIIKEFSGNELVGTKYQQLLPWATPHENADQAFRVIAGDFVTTEDGTGIVHIAPTFGADDARVAEDNGVPPMLVLDNNGKAVPLVDLQGRFLSILPEPFGGKFVKNEYYDAGQEPEKSVDVDIIIHLKENNLAFKAEKYKHSYPHCWRTDKPILYYPLDSWFIKIAENRQKLVELNQRINWKPKSTGEGRFANWLSEAKDWNLSRSRYWGIPLPIWRTEDKNQEICIGSMQELIYEIQKSMEAGVLTENPFEGFEPENYSEENYGRIDLHKNIVDKIVLVTADGEPMYREADLIDVWFDSGSMPYAQWHYPFNHGSKTLDQIIPADFIAEGVDQTRGWFYTLHAIAGLVFDDIAYKNVVSNGLVLDKNGQKMSKRLGNAVDPFETIEKYGPDATRWYMIANAQPWENLKFDLDGVEEARRKFFGTLYNTYSFFALYANVDGFDNTAEQVPLNQRAELDQWIISELHTLIREVNAYYADYEPTRAARAIQAFTGDYLSNWYVRLSRRRFWKGEYSVDKIAAYQTLHTVLKTIAQLASPIAPFFMDRLYRDLTKLQGEEMSVHLSHFPEYDPEKVQTELQEKTHLAQRATSMIFSLRKQANLKVRQPLQKVLIPALDGKMQQRLQEISELLKQEVNVKEIQILTQEEAADQWVKEIKPNFKELGPKVGKMMKAVAAAISQLDTYDIQILEELGEVPVKIGEDEEYLLKREDVEIKIKDIEGWVVNSEGNLTIALDTYITPQLRSEGLAREMVNRIQNLRKGAGLEVTDKIRIHVETDDLLKEAIEENSDYIKTETQAVEIAQSVDKNVAQKEIIDEIVALIEIEKL
ncbi:MAG: isoleucine--tRNA ligase [Weeksellaceae bacterium]|nr:isoleucine--tRNA ligase [Weeksellaceae bacterium]